ncbi:MAG TPA: alpha/beta fold hydrolase [Gemmataceae bacterium]|jgi:acetyl esterase/lipase
MRRVLQSPLFACLVVLLSAVASGAEDASSYTRTRDVIYGRKDGLALTMDVIAPKEKPNGLGVVFVVSGGWRSSTAAIRPELFTPFLRHGYTVFAVVHGTQPKFTVPEIIEDIHRAVRFIRFHARDYRIDPDHLGITGASAGGHLSLMMGTAGATGKPRTSDPVDRVSSRVQAVACFFPPTDFLNYGKEGAVLDCKNIDRRFRAALDFQALDNNERVFKRITDESRIQELLRDISPISHVSPDDPPTLIIHGDKDTLVPLQQSQRMVAKLKEAGVPNNLIVKKDCGHGWITILKDTETLADWFDRYLKNEPQKAAE